MFRRQKQNPVAKKHTRKAELAMQMQSTFEILESVGMSANGMDRLLPPDGLACEG
jgi:hypothetical protein